MPNLIEVILSKYIEFPLKISSSHFFFNIHFVGVLFTCLYILSEYRAITNYLERKIRILTGCVLKFLHRKKNKTAVIALILSMLSLGINYLDYSSKTDRKLSIFCVPVNKFATHKNYVLIKTNCKVRNEGFITLSIDKIEPTYYFSNKISLDRGVNDKSYYHYDGDLESSIALPYIISSGEQVNFTTNIAIPIEPWDQTNNTGDQKWSYNEHEFEIQKYSECIKSEKNFNCFQNLVGKPLINYIYETIRYPAAISLPVPINGVGIGVEYFDQFAETEVNLFDLREGFYLNNKIPVLAINRTQYIGYIENLHRPWYRKIFYIEDTINTNQSHGADFVYATGVYIFSIISVLGYFIFMRLLSTKILMMIRSK